MDSQNLRESVMVIVGSGTNMKLQAVTEVLNKWKVIGIEVETGVNEQPIGRTEMREGAINRAKRALEINEKNGNLNTLIAFGIESGIEKLENDKWIDIASVVCFYRTNINTAAWNIIEKWSEFIEIPSDWAELSVKNPNLTYMQNAVKKNSNLKSVVNVKDPHLYLTGKSRKLFLMETIELIHQEILEKLIIN